jgi:hypothetical protein
MPNDDHDHDRASSDAPDALPSFATAPPPAGVVDEHSAPTTIAALPEAFLADLKAATRQHAARAAKTRDLQTTQHNESAASASPSAGPAPVLEPVVVVEPTPELPVGAVGAVEAVEAVEAVPLPAAAPSAAPPVRDAANESISVFAMAVLALLAIGAIVWTLLTTLR